MLTVQWFHHADYSSKRRKETVQDKVNVNSAMVQRVANRAAI
jgi:hypothetical protein